MAWRSIYEQYNLYFFVWLTADFVRGWSGLLPPPYGLCEYVCLPVVVAAVAVVVGAVFFLDGVQQHDSSTSGSSKMRNATRDEGGCNTYHSSTCRI